MELLACNGGFFFFFFWDLSCLSFGVHLIDCIYYFYATLQLLYTVHKYIKFKYKGHKGRDPLTEAFDQMKVHNLN